MFEGIINGWHLIKDSIRVFLHHPKFLLPLLIVWLIYAPIILYLTYGMDWEALTGDQVLLVILGVIFLFVFLLSFSCSILLELIQQLESEEKMDLIKAFSHTLRYNLIKIIPLVIIWTIIWFILLIIQALLSGEEEESEELTAENAAKTLANYENFSLSQAFFKALEKGIRMIVFLILPAIVWENLSFGKAIKKGIGVFKTHLSTFVSGFLLTLGAEMVLFLPPAILFILSGRFGITFPPFVWFLTIIYIAFAWSYTIYLEQMFIAELYLWDLKWEKEVENAKRENLPLPQLKDVKRPSLLDEVPELLGNLGVVKK